MRTYAFKLVNAFAKTHFGGNSEKTDWKFNFTIPSGNTFLIEYKDNWTTAFENKLSILDSKTRWQFTFLLLKDIEENLLLNSYQELNELEKFHKKSLSQSEKESLLNTISAAYHEMSFTAAQSGTLANFLLTHSELSFEQSKQAFRCVLSIYLSDELEIDEIKESIELSWKKLENPNFK